MKTSSSLRVAEHKALSEVSLSGKIIDLGGDRNSEYQRLFNGDFSVTVLNYSEKTGADIIHDLEKPLPITDGSYDGALLINVLEHIYHAEKLVKETHRIVRTGGIIVIAVPFLFPVHPSPKDYWRFTDETLRTMLRETGFNEVKVTALGSGVFSARTLFVQRLLPTPIRFIYSLFAYPLAKLADFLFRGVAKLLRKQYLASDYALGYVVTAVRG